MMGRAEFINTIVWMSGIIVGLVLSVLALEFRDWRERRRDS